MSKDKKLKIGFVGQGVVGKAVADDFEERGFNIVRYSLEKEHSANKNKISKCNFVFIAVPTPTKNGVQDNTAVMKALSLVGLGKTAVIKSTILPGTTDLIQNKFSKINIFHSPEFLIANNAKEDATKPFINIVGIPSEKFNNKKSLIIAESLIKILPKSLNNVMCRAVEAELKKFSHNIHGYFQIVFWNMIHDYATNLGADWSVMKKMLDSNIMISKYYTSPMHKTGRGAGGHCFIKDYSAFLGHFSKIRTSDPLALEIFKLIEEKNLELLFGTGKDLELIEKVYGKKPKRRKK